VSPEQGKTTSEESVVEKTCQRGFGDT